MLVWKIAVNRISKRCGSSLITFFIMLISFSIVLLGSFLYGTSHLDKSRFMRCLDNKPEQYGFMFIESEGDIGMDEFLDNVRGLSCIDEIGEYSSYSILEYREDRVDDKEGVWKKIVDLQESRGINEDSRGDIYEVDMISGTVPLFNLKYKACLTEDERKSILEKYSNVEWFCLGYDYPDMTPGEFFKYGSSLYCLYGIFDKDSYIPQEGVMENDYIGGVSGNVFKLDSSFVCLTDEGISNKRYFRVNDAYGIDEAIDEITALAREHNTELITGRTDMVIERRNSTNARLTSLMEVFSLVCVLTSSLVLMCSQCLNILRETKVLGVLISCGVSKSQIYKSYFAENIMKLFFPLCLVVGYSFIMVRGYIRTFKLDSVLAEYFWNVEYVCCIPAILCAAVIVVVFASLIPICFLKKALPSRLIKGEL